MTRSGNMSGQPEVWVSDGLPAVATDHLASLGRRWRRFPLVGGMTVWAEPPVGRVTVAMASPNRLGIFEPLPPDGGWADVWWWSDPLSADHGGHGAIPGVERIPAPAPLPIGRSRAAAVERCRRAADYLVRRVRHLRGVRIPPAPHGRRFPLLLPLDPASVVEGVADELWVPRPVDGWPGLMVCEVGWWQSRNRLDALAEIVGKIAGGQRPAPLEVAPQVWSFPDP